MDRFLPYRFINSYMTWSIYVSCGCRGWLFLQLQTFPNAFTCVFSGIPAAVTSKTISMRYGFSRQAVLSGFYRPAVPHLYNQSVALPTFLPMDLLPPDGVVFLSQPGILGSEGSRVHIICDLSGSLLVLGYIVATSSGH